MELKDFISNSLKQIIDGIADAQEYAKKQNTHGMVGLVEEAHKYRTVNFSIVVTTEDASNTKAGAGIFVGGFTLGAQGSKGESNQATNRIEFQVPIRYPQNF